MTQRRYENGKQAIERWNLAFRALSAEPRRQLIVSLLDCSTDEPVALPESAINPTVPANPEKLTSDLHHNHLPTLADSGFIEWEASPFVAYRGPRFEEVAVVFEALYSSAIDIPDPLVEGCQRLEWEQQVRFEK
ncbi:hypothetical protein [Natronorubrum sp. DTA28]|uniref:hypothetical protein n=1 Tax=Natronorubrum sp. DTA28 TaxID=3447019 RepID=UPI003F84C41B